MILCTKRNKREGEFLKKQEWLAQVKRGILEYSILLLVDKKATYGYDLISALNKWEVLSTSEGTIYPLLRRLEKDKLIESSWRETVPGVPPRKYYSLTVEGIKMLKTMNCEWEKLISSINQIKTCEEM